MRLAVLALVLIGSDLPLRAAQPGSPAQIQGDRFRTSEGDPVAARWAFGLTDTADLAAYREAGLNVVYIDLPTADSAQSRQAADLALAASQQGLAVVVALNPIVATCGDRSLDLSDPEAVRRTSVWLSQTVDLWKDVPGLLAYALEEDVESRLQWNDLGFQQYLQYLYDGNLGTLNDRWRANLKSFTGITCALPGALDAPRVGQMGRATLDLAHWGRDGVQALLRRWCTAIAALDPAHSVIGGRMSRWRTLLAAPSELAGLQPAMLARTGWADPTLHQAGAVAVANQSGRFAAVPVLETNADAVSLLRWTRIMFGRGAAGVSFASWPELRDSADLRRAVQEALAEVDRLDMVAFAPQPSAAVLLEPWARGPLQDGGQTWGYGGMAGDEPGGLTELLRLSTRYGPLGVLAPRDLDRVRLDRLGCLFAPAAFDLPDSAVEALRGYVAAGGVLVGDLGIGCYQPYGDLRQMPATLQRVFGVSIGDVRTLMDVVLTSRQRERVRLVPPRTVAFPELLPELAHPGSLVITHVNALFPDAPLNAFTPPRMAGGLLRSPAAFIYPIDDTTRIVAEQGSIGGRPPLQPLPAGISVHPYGQGVAAFMSTFLWPEWMPGELLFDQVHDGLLGQRPQVVDAAARHLCEPDTYLARSDQELWLHRLSNAPTIAQVDVPTLDGELYADGLNAVRRPLQRGPAAPVQVSVAPLINRRILNLPGGALRVEGTVPIALWPQYKQASADVMSYTPERIVLQLFGAGDQAQIDNFGRWAVLDPQPEDVILIIRDGRYPVAAGSQHRAQWWAPATGSGELFGDRTGIIQTETTLTAGPDQRLTVREVVRRARLEITPLMPPERQAPTAATP